MHSFFRPGRNGNSAGSEVTHRPMAAEINRCRLVNRLNGWAPRNILILQNERKNRANVGTGWNTPPPRLRRQPTSNDTRVPNHSRPRPNTPQGRRIDPTRQHTQTKIKITETSRHVNTFSTSECCCQERPLRFKFTKSKRSLKPSISFHFSWHCCSWAFVIHLESC